jgi:hypothetical protein
MNLDVMKRLRRGCPALAVFIVLVLVFDGPSALAQRKKRTAAVLPADVASWLNSPPITAEMLQGKAAVLWYYEES